MSEIKTFIQDQAGRITLTRPHALNAVTHQMCLQIETALDNWRADPEVKIVLIDAEGEKAFSAGGDISHLYQSGLQGDFESGRKFWRDEYRMNAKIREFNKPVVSFLQGFTMGGGMGVGCHGSHRIVGKTSQIAMPECGIGLVPDVGGSMILANAPGWTGVYAGLTGARMKAGDAIRMGFADIYIPEEDWEGLKAQISAEGTTDALAQASVPPTQGEIQDLQPQIDAHFFSDSLPALLTSLRQSETGFSAQALKAVSRNSPLSLAVTIQMLHRLRGNTNIRDALEMEYRFTSRAVEHADILEGIRAAIIDKDRNPSWKHALDDVPQSDLDRMLAPPDADPLTF